MKNRKISAVVAGIIGISCIVPPAVSAVGNDVFFYESFENGNTYWSSRGSASVSLDTQNAYNGTNSLYVTGRTQNWNGASAKIDANAFRTGGTYSFSVAVMQKSGSPVNMKFTMQQGEGADAVYTEIASATAVSGDWTILENTAFTIPSGSENMTIYIEAPESLTDFYIDSVQGAVQGVSVIEDSQEHTEPSADVLRGDFNLDGKVNAYDMITARKMLVTSFAGGKAEVDLRFADTDGNGEFGISDVVMLSKYILGQVSGFPEVQVITTTTSQSEPQIITTTVTTGGNSQDGSYMQRISGDIAIKESASVSSARAGVDYGKMEKKTYYSKDGGLRRI